MAANQRQRIGWSTVVMDDGGDTALRSQNNDMFSTID